MGDDSRQLPLERRVPGATGAGPAKSARPELPEALLQHMQAVVSAAKAQSAVQEEQEHEQEAPPEHVALPDQTAHPEPSASWRQLVLGAASVLKPPDGKTRPLQSGSPTEDPSDGDVRSDTAPLPRLTAPGDLASPVITNVERQPDRAAQAEGEQAGEAERERAAQADRRLASQTERLRAIEAERKAEAKRGAQAERERAGQAERAPRRAAQLERIRAERAAFAREREQAQRQEAGRAAQRSLTAQPGKSAESDNAAKPPSARPPARERASSVVQTPADLQDRHAPPKTRKAPIRRRYRMGALIATATVLLATGWLVLEHPSHTPTHTLTHSRRMSAADMAKVIRNQAAVWVAQQVARGDIVSCDPSMCRTLKAQGIPAHDLLILGPKGADLSDCTVVVATAAVRNRLGSRLDSIYAPAVLASFGSGKARIDIRQTAPDGPAAFWSALRADQRERKTVEPTLAGSLQVVVSATVRSALLDGQVDPRLYLLIEGMATQLPQPIHIMALGDLSPAASPGIPFRSATLIDSIANLQKLLTFAQGLKTPLVPSLSKIIHLDGQPALVVAFPAPSPLGLFNVHGK
jgi:hypothetical protein